jgi:hypothetical protein
MWPGNQGHFTWPRHLVRGSHRFGHDPVVGREVADRIRAGGIAGERKCLAAAAAEVDLAAVAAPARFGHPVCAAKALEEG